MSPLKKSFLTNAPRILLGAFFLLSSCKDASSESEPSPAPEEPATHLAPTPPPLPDEPPIGEATPISTEAPTSTETVPKSEGTRFLSYNLKNYLTMDVYLKGGIKEERPKDPAEIEALVKIIVSEKPHILGISEIGTADDLADLQARLKKAGLDLPHSVHAGGFDKVRHLAILSAHPILENNSQDTLPFQIGDLQRMMGRGILSVLIDLPGGPTHFVGLHLKSKRPIKEMSEAEIRLNEARLAREHCDAILTENPDARIVTYGDFNDTRRTPPLSALMGRSNSKKHLADVFVKDSRQELWTHYWSYQQQYARFDYVLTSPAITSEVDIESSYICDPENWNEASDHRAIMVTFQATTPEK